MATERIQEKESDTPQRLTREESAVGTTSKPRKLAVGLKRLIRIQGANSTLGGQS